MKKLANKLILNLIRKGYTYDKLRTYIFKSLIVFVILLITLGLNWKFKSETVVVHINYIIWWSIILCQNIFTFLHFKFLKRILLFRNEYKNQLMKSDYVMVGFDDDKFKLGKNYKVCEYNNISFTNSKQSYFLGGDMLLENNQYIIIEGDKIFKFISLKENRKLKLEKLKRI